MHDFSTFNILVCDDSITNVVILSKLIDAELGAKVDTITDPRQTMQHIQDQEYDLLLLDLEMPHLNGFQVMELIRKKHDIDSLPILILTGKQGIETRNKALSEGANDFVNKPFDQTEVILRVSNLLKVRHSYKAQKNINAELEKKVQQRTLELSEATETLIHRLALAGELRDNETGQHVVRVGKYAGLLAESFGLPQELVFMIEKTSPMHDIGKIGIPDSILLKNGKLDEGERKIMDNHTTYGSKLLGDHSSMLIQMASSIALSHHERWDGTGYPSGFKGESIPIEGRITAIADVFDALTTSRSYKEAWSEDKAFEFIEQQAGIMFDPTLATLFVENKDKVLEICKTYAD